MTDEIRKDDALLQMDDDELLEWAHTECRRALQHLLDPNAPPGPVDHRVEFAARIMLGLIKVKNLDLRTLSPDELQVLKALADAEIADRERAN